MMLIKKLVLATILSCCYFTCLAMWQLPDPLAETQQSRQEMRKGIYDPEADTLFYMGLRALELSHDPYCKIEDKNITPQKLYAMGINMIEHAAKHFDNIKAHYTLWYFQHFKVMPLTKQLEQYAKSFPSRLEWPSTAFSMGLIELVQKIERLKKAASDTLPTSSTIQPFTENTEDINYNERIKTLVHTYGTLNLNDITLELKGQ